MLVSCCVAERGSTGSGQQCRLNGLAEARRITRCFVSSHLHPSSLRRHGQVGQRHPATNGHALVSNYLLEYIHHDVASFKTVIHHQSWAPSHVTTLPTWASLSPSTTLRTRSPARAASTAPSFFIFRGVLPPRCVADSPGLTANVLTPSSFNTSYQVNMHMLTAALAHLYPWCVMSPSLGQPSCRSLVLAESQSSNAPPRLALLELRNMSRARGDLMSKEAKRPVTTWAPATLTSYALLKTALKLDASLLKVVSKRAPRCTR